MTDRDALALLRELTAMVRAECPSLLNEDSGGDARLSLAIDDALSTPPPADLVALTDALIAAANRRKGLPHGAARVGAEYDEAKAYEALLAYKLPAAAPRVPSLDVEGLIRTCVPGGQSCDPQGVADAIREWFAAPRVPERDTACLCCSAGCQDGCRCKPAAPPPPPQVKKRAPAPWDPPSIANEEYDDPPPLR